MEKQPAAVTALSELVRCDNEAEEPLLRRE